MAESPLERLKRIAAEKKAAGAAVQPAVVETVVTAPSIASQIEATNASVTTDSNLGVEVAEVPEVLEASSTGSTELDANESNSPDLPTELATPTPSNHPLAMQFAEMEASLLSDAPNFKVLLRDVHRQLGMEPELVTMMTEAEVALIVQGMVHLANTEIIDPGKAKKAKAEVAATKKRVITEDDL